MKYTTLNNNIKMPMAGIGTFLLTPDEAEAAVLEALKDGYRLVDTANAYVNEKAVGRAIKKSGLDREEIFLETKIWPSFYEQEDAIGLSNFTKEQIEEILDICEVKPAILQTEVHPYAQQKELKEFLRKRRYQDSGMVSTRTWR